MLSSLIARQYVANDPFDGRSLPAHLVVAVEGLVGLLLFAWLGFTLNSSTLLMPPAWGAFLFLSAWGARRIGWARTAGGCETMALTYCQGAAAMALLFPLTALSTPLADARLAAMDQFLGFDWVSMAAWLKGHPSLVELLRIVYRTMYWQPALILIFLFASRREDRGWQFTTASALAMVGCVLIYPFVPAVGTFIHFGVRPSDFPMLSTPWAFGPVIEAIKHGNRSITAESFTGFVSFPSYHASAAVLLMWAAWPTKLRIPFVILNVIMLFSTIVIGAHYFVDIIAGAIIALIATWVAGQLLAHGDEAL